MFLGMTFCLPLAYYTEWAQRRKGGRVSAPDDAAQPLLMGEAADDSGSGGDGKQSELRQVLLLAIPTFFDLVATVRRRLLQLAGPRCTAVVACAANLGCSSTATDRPHLQWPGASPLNHSLSPTARRRCS